MNSINSQEQDFKKIIPWICFIGFMFFINYSSRALIATLLVNIELEFSIDHASATMIAFIQSVGLSLGLLSSGFIISYISPKKQIVSSAIGAGIFLLAIYQASSLLEIKILFASMGFMAGLYFAAGMASISYLTPAKHWASAISIHELGPATSFLFTPLIVSATLVFFNWKAAAGVMGILCILAGLAFALWGRGLNTPIPKTNLKGIASILKEPGFWIFLWLFVFGIAGEFAIFSVLPLHLSTERGFSPEYANTITGISRIVAPLAVLLGGWLANRFGISNILKSCLFFHGLALASMASDNFNIAIIGIIIQPLLVACMFVSIFGYFAAYFPLTKQSVVLALVTPLASAFGAGVAPAFLGQLAVYKSFSFGFVIFALLSLLTIFLPLTGKAKENLH